MQTRWTTTALTGAITAGLVLTGCSSGTSSPSAPSSKAGRGGLKAVSNCLSSHGADPAGLNGLLTGTAITATASQLAALRGASKACESSVSGKLKRGLSATVACLDQHGYHLNQNAPLPALFSLDLSRPAVATAVTNCSAALPSRASKSTGS